MSDIYDLATYQPKKSVGALLSRVRVEMLAALGYEPVGFERPADAIAACRSEPDRFDAIVISHGASDPDGLHLARALHEFMPRCPCCSPLRPRPMSAPMRWRKPE